MGRLMYIPIDMIYPNPRNPRKNFEPEAMAELVASVRQVGILQPVVLVRDEDENQMKYRLVAGERRYRAALEADIKKLPAVVRQLTPDEELEVMIIENLQRRDVDPIEEAQGMKSLLQDGGYTQDALAEKLGCSQSHIANRLRLLRLPDQVQENISRKILSAGHANALLKAEKSPEILKEATRRIVEDHVPVAKAADAVSETITRKGKPLYKHYISDWDPQFNVKKCNGCEYRVMAREFAGAKERPYCIKPDCWEDKQVKAKQDLVEKLSGTTKSKMIVDIDKLDWNQYDMWIEDDSSFNQSECFECDKRKLGRRQDQKDSDARLYCLDPECLKKKRAARSRERSREARDAFKAELAEISEMAAAKAKEIASWAIVDKQMLIYIAAQILGNIANQYDRYDRSVTRYKYLKEKFGWDNDCLKWGPSRMVEGDDWSEFKTLLESLSEEKLWEVILEWPAVAHGLDGFMDWIFKTDSEWKPNKEQKVEDFEFSKDMKPRSYLDENGQEIFVAAGLGGDTFGSFRCKPNGSLQRVKSPAMPMVDSREEAEKNLQAWAEKKGLQLLSECSQSA